MTTTPQHCNSPMVWFTYGAPGIGGGWYCETCHHTIDVNRPRTLTPNEAK